MDLLTVLTHEVGHLLEEEHEDYGIMGSTLAAGVRLAPSPGDGSVSAVDRVFASESFVGRGQGGRVD
jgi:hypothetical protein